MSVQITRITEADRTVWQPMFEAYLDFYQTSRPPEVIDIAFARMVSGKAHEFRGFIARCDGQALGFTHFLEHRKMWDIQNTLYLMDLFVTPEARNKGVARKLITAVYDEARGADASGVYWLTHEGNHNAKALYDKVALNSGFVKYAHTF